MRAQRNARRMIIVTGLLAFTLFSAAPVFSKGGPALAETTPHPKSNNPNVTYQTVPLTMQMEAGVPFHLEDHPGGIRTIHSGIGWMAPFGRASYVGGIGYPEAAEYRPDYMDDDSWSEMFSTGLFCIYSLEDGDIYAFDGVMGNIEGRADDDGKMDYLLNVIVGGTGRYRNASGILLGRTPGRFDVTPGGLPEILLKVMEGYINIEVKKSKRHHMLPAVGTKNPQLWPDVLDALYELKGSYGEMVIPINIEMEAGRDQWNDLVVDTGTETYVNGTTIIAGNGWVEPLGRAGYHYGFGYDEALGEEGAKPDFMDEDSWLESYPAGTMCIYHLEDGDIYAYGGIAGNLVPESDDGKVDCVVEVIVGGSGLYEGASGMILGYTFGRGEAAPTEGHPLGIELPDSILKIMEGYIVFSIEEPQVGTEEDS